MTNLNTLSSLTTPAIVAFVTTLASALAISIALHNKSKSKKATMPTTPKDGEKKAGAAAAATRDRDDPPDLPPRFVIGSARNRSSRSRSYPRRLPPPPPPLLRVVVRGRCSCSRTGSASTAAARGTWNCSGPSRTRAWTCAPWTTTAMAAATAGRGGTPTSSTITSSTSSTTSGIVGRSARTTAASSTPDGSRPRRRHGSDAHDPEIPRARDRQAAAEGEDRGCRQSSPPQLHNHSHECRSYYCHEAVKQGHRREQPQRSVITTES